MDNNSGNNSSPSAWKHSGCHFGGCQKKGLKTSTSNQRSKLSYHKEKQRSSRWIIHLSCYCLSVSLSHWLVLPCPTQSNCSKEHLEGIYSARLEFLSFNTLQEYSTHLHSTREREKTCLGDHVSMAIMELN